MTLPLLALALALGVNLYLRVKQPAKGNRLSAVKTESRTPGRARTSAGGKLSDSLLTDSILSIVQSYYVDPARVENKVLVDNVLGALSLTPRVKTGRTGTGVFVEVDADRREFPLAAEPRYQEVLDLFAKIGGWLDEAGVAVTAGESPEKNAPSSVALLNGMLSQLDAHSTLLSPDAYKELRQGTEGSFGGLGVLVGIRDNLLTVIKPLPRSPAQRAGIKKHDRILGIDGVFTYGYSLDELVEYMRGDPGTAVKLSLLRDGAVSPADVTLSREVIQVDSVTATDLSQNGLNVLQLAIENFSSRTSREVLGAIKKAKASHDGKLHGLILDLRANPGGLLDQAVQVADLFLQSGVIVTTKGRREEVESAGSGIDETLFSIAILIDGDSASASEIVAGALQDHGRAVVIGQPSFGKGSVQTIFELPGERALKLTIARYYTPQGRSIQNVGIIPDVWLQPVTRAEENANLFGPFRYKNERFLRNHLETEREVAWSVPARKAYYLVDPEAGDKDKKPADRELDLALAMIKKIKDTYGDRLPDGTGRASHWLGLAGPVVAGYADKLDAETRGFLQAKHKVDWAQSRPDAQAQSLKISVEPGTPTEIMTGGTLKVKWRIQNGDPQRVDRLSLFVRSEVSGIETTEILLGGLEPGKERQGVVDVQIPRNWEADGTPLPLRLGLAADAWPVPGATADLLVTILPRPMAELTADVKLVDDASGTRPGVLESREKAKLRVELYNAGDAAAREITLRVINLSGSQVALKDGALPVPALEPGASHVVEVEIVGGKALYTQDIGLGLLVESSDLKAALRQRFAVDGWPNAVASKSMGLQSH